MAIGTGIFLGLAILAIVLLYTQTKDRWRWGRIAKWTAAVIATPIVIGAGWLAYDALQDHLRSRPERATAYADIALGDSMEEVRYSKGVPDDVMKEDDSLPNNPRGWLTVVSVPHLPKGQDITDYLHWSYDDQFAGRIDAEFSPDSKTVVRVSCYSGENQTCAGLVGVSSGTTEAVLLDRLGEPSSADIEPESGVKTLRYAQFNATYRLKERRVYSLRLEDEAKFAAEQANPPATLAEANAPKLPPICDGTKDADQCAKFLEKYGSETGDWPPCKSGAANCKPWERDWQDGDELPRGAIVPE